MSLRQACTRSQHDCFKVRDTCVSLKQASTRTQNDCVKVRSACASLRQASTGIVQKCRVCCKHIVVSTVNLVASVV